MTSLPNPPISWSLAPRPRISSSPSKPSSKSGLSVPESRPPLGQPGTSFVSQPFSYKPFSNDGPMYRASTFRSMGCVSSHRACSDAALAERVCSLLVVSVCPLSSCGASERVPAQLTTRRRTAHPIRKGPTTAMRCPLLLDLAGAYMPHHYQEGRHHR